MVHDIDQDGTIYALNIKSMTSKVVDTIHTVIKTELACVGSPRCYLHIFQLPDYLKRQLHGFTMCIPHPTSTPRLYMYIWFR